MKKARKAKLGDVYKFGKDKLKVVKLVDDLVFFADGTHATQKDLKDVKRVK